MRERHEEVPDALRTIPGLFRRSAERYKDHPAVRNTADIPREPREITYGELEELAERLAAGLETAGLRRGDRVAIISRPRIRYAAAVLAVLKLGAWVVPLDPSFTADELTRLLKHAGVSHVFAGEAVFEKLDAYPAERIDLDDAGGRTFDSLLVDGKVEAAPPTPEDIAFLAYTSGTTGDPKGVMLSHGNIAADLINGTKVIPVFPSDVFLAIAPWHHILGLVACLILPLYGGAVALYTDDYRRTAELMKEHGVSIFVGVPKLYHAMYERLIGKISATALGRLMWRWTPRLVGRRIKQKLSGGALRFFVSGSAPLNPSVALGFRRMGIGMMEGYGLTETSPVISVCDPFGRKGGSVGRPIPGMEARVKDPAPDGIGELLVRGPIVMQGYYQNETATRRAIDAEGWFHTGDLACLDESGEIFLKGRAKNVIVLDSGKNVYPEEIEWELGRIPYVEEVMVRSGPDGIEAIVFPNHERLTEDGILGRVREVIWDAVRRAQTTLAPYKRLRSIRQLVLVDQPFPKTSTLDIKRHLYDGDASSATG